MVKKVKAGTTKITTSKSNHIDIATTQLGVKEVGVNNGVEVKKYLKSVGLGAGHSYCMAFVHWCVANSNNIQKPLIKSGHVYTQFNAMKKSGITSTTPKLGSIFCKSRPTNTPNSGHTGLVIAIDSTFIYTIEANIIVNGIAGVHAHKRLISSIDWGYIHI